MFLLLNNKEEARHNSSGSGFHKVGATMAKALHLVKNCWVSGWLPGQAWPVNIWWIRQMTLGEYARTSNIISDCGELLYMNVKALKLIWDTTVSSDTNQ